LPSHEHAVVAETLAFPDLFASGAVINVDKATAALAG